MGTVVKTFRFGPNKDNGPAPAFGDRDSVLSEPWQDAIALIAERAHVRVRRFEIARGNPLKFYSEESVDLGGEASS